MSKRLPLLPLPPLPRHDPLRSPEVVRVLDAIRFRLKDDQPEFCWFAREYPRCYRHHLLAARFRLETVHGLLSELHKEFAHALPALSARTFGFAVSDTRVDRIYWDFASFLSNICTGLDLLARVVGPAYRDQTSASFSRFCKKADPNDTLSVVMVRARDGWVRRVKDYRDCLVHYTPVDTHLCVFADRRGDGWEVRTKLPVNPNARDITRFRYSRRVELLRYAITVARHMSALDMAVAHELQRRFRSGNFPVRTDGLFSIGTRTRPDDA